MSEIQNLGRIEVITSIESVKIVQDEREGFYTIQFNQGSLVPFKFDGKKFYIEAIEESARNEWLEKNKDRDMKDQKAIKEFNSLPKILEEINVVYNKDPKDHIINLTDYINDIISFIKK